VIASCARKLGPVTLLEEPPDIIFQAAQKGETATLEFFFERCKVSTEIVDKRFHQTALSHAAEYGQIKVVQYLIKIGASIQAKDQGGRTALWWAVREGRKEVILELLLSGASVEPDIISASMMYGHHDVAQLFGRM
jgi:Ankyrin repeats (3 copies)